MKRRVVTVLFTLIALGLAFGLAFGIVSARKREQVIADNQQVKANVESAGGVEPLTREPTFVGRQVCQECHAENFRLHGNHGHARTFADAREPQIANKFIGKTFDAGERFGTYNYDADDEGLYARLPEQFGDVRFRLHVALGSGHSAITLLSLIPDAEKGTVGIEHRASWFNNDDQLGPTPGQGDQDVHTAGEFFGVKHEDAVMQKCVYCHTTTGKIVDQEIVGLTANVNCEKCHGPASEHVRQARESNKPPPFAVGRDDWDTESEVQLCGDCHRLPMAISRKELREYPDLLLRFQPIGMLRSACYLESEGRLKCTTCHNPHRSVHTVPKADHVQNCVKCHLENSASHVACPVSPRDGCIECHMPATELADVGTSFHDHWIRIRDEK